MNKNNSIKYHLTESIGKIKELDKNTTLILVFTAILNIISYYYTSRKFFRINILPNLDSSFYTGLYEFLYWFMGDFFTFFIIPVLLILFIHKNKPVNFGFRFGNYKLGLKVYFIFMLIFLPIIWVVSSFESFSNLYPHLFIARTSIKIFLIYELGMFFYMAGWEFIWRGYMLFGLEEKFGWYAIFIQTIPFVILHNGKPPIETFGAVLAGIALGVLAFRTRSFFYCVLIHFSVMFFIDLFGLIRYQTQYFKIFF